MKLPPPDTTVDKPFGSTEEDAIISLSLDQPEFFGTIAQTIKPQMFKQETRQYVFAQLANAYEKYSTIPTRSLLCDIVAKDLTAEDPYEEILDLLKRPSNPREVPQVKATVLNWAQTQAYGMLFNDESQAAYHRRDFQHLENILEEARKLTDVRGKTFSFWDQWEEVFIEDASEHITTGFLKLNNELNGGPSPGEVLCWMAATNVGKSIVLMNNAVSCITPTGTDPDVRGLDTIIISLEMSDKKISKRQLGNLTGIPLNDLKTRRSDVERAMESMKKRAGHCEIIEFPPDEVSVDHIAAAVDQIRRTKGWSPKVIILDYLDLLMSRVPAYNKDEYLRQKHVATEVRGLAKKLRVPIFTATQTNRSGVQTNGKEKDKGPENIGLNQIAESFGKAMPLDYIISINQTDEERKGAGGIPRFRFYIIKNRDGRREITIEASINYNNMRVREL